MNALTLFSMASQRTAWLGQRQSIVAENVANANTPGYTSKDLAPFSSVLDETTLRMTGTSPMHMASLGTMDGQGGTAGTGAPGDVVRQDAWDVKHSGNSVSLDQEMLKAGEISREYSLDTSIMKSFHRMLIMSVKS